MLTLLKSSTTGYILVGLAAAYALYSTYRYTYSAGYAKGKQETVNMYQPIIDKFNAETIARNNKIAQLEQTATQLQQEYNELQQQVPKVIERTVVKYIEKNPIESAECGVSESMADAYNEFLEEATP